MTIYPFNIYEKSFTPYWASLAPKHLVHRHAIQRFPSKQTSLWRDARTKNFVKWIKKNLMSRTWLYHTGILVCIYVLILVALIVEQSIRAFWIKLFKLNNYEVIN
jgi:hypothetical protein